MSDREVDRLIKRSNDAMRYKLSLNDSKGSWENIDLEALIDFTKKEFIELYNSFLNFEIKESEFLFPQEEDVLFKTRYKRFIESIDEMIFECADIQNFCGMLIDNLTELKEKINNEMLDV